MMAGDILMQAWPPRGLTPHQHRLLCLHPLRFLHHHHQIQAALSDALENLINWPDQVNGWARRNAVLLYLGSEYRRHAADEDEVLKRFVLDGLRRRCKGRIAEVESIFAVSRKMHEEGGSLASKLVAKLMPSGSLLAQHALPLWIPAAVRYVKQSTHHLEWEASVLYPAVALSIGDSDCSELGRRIAARRQVSYIRIVKAPEPLPVLRQFGVGSRRNYEFQ